MPRFDAAPATGGVQLELRPGARRIINDVSSGFYRSLDRSQGPAFLRHSLSRPDGNLLTFVGHQVAIATNLEAVRYLATEIPAARSLVSLHRLHPLTNTNLIRSRLASATAERIDPLHSRTGIGAAPLRLLIELRHNNRLCRGKLRDSILKAGIQGRCLCVDHRHDPRRHPQWAKRT